MRRMRAALLIILIVGVAFPQTLMEHSYIARLDTSTFDPHYGWTHFCVLVYQDGRYRMEREKVNEDNKKAYKVYLGQLPDARVKELQDAVNNPDFASIQTPGKHGGLIQDPDVVKVVVPREDRLQEITFDTARQRHPYEKTMKPLLKWMKEVEKAKGEEAQGQTANGCAAPVVFYRRPVSGDPSTPKN